MKKLIFIFQILFLLLPFLVLAQIDYSTEFSLNDLSITQTLAPDQSHYTVINLNDCFSSSEVGKPDLPRESAQIDHLIPLQNDHQKWGSI